jgi:glycosyltransferase involved in cell wall biosynthesis
MKFSVLLPTRNRLQYLCHAVESVRRQSYGDWELVISDNFSEEDITGFVRSIDDPRINYFRTPRLVPVTENWNNALQHSSGDYVIMLGDDDILLPRYFETVRQLVDEYHRPDIVYSSGYIYAYPHVMPNHPNGYLHRSGCAEFLKRSAEPFLLDRATARRVVEHSLKFQLRFDYNMQYTTFSRRIIDLLKDRGLFFQSPFPDFYATNVLFLKATRILVHPGPLVVVGITPKSYGFYHFNQQESAGVAFLQCSPDAALVSRLERILLPGTIMNTNWLCAMEMLCANYGAEFGLRVDYGRYRRLQLLNHYEDLLVRKSITELEVCEMRKRLRPREHCLYYSVLAASKLFGQVLTRRLLRSEREWLSQYPQWQATFVSRKFGNISDVYDFFSSESSAA